MRRPNTPIDHYTEVRNKINQLLAMMNNACNSITAIRYIKSDAEAMLALAGTEQEKEHFKQLILDAENGIKVMEAHHNGLAAELHKYTNPQKFEY